MGFPKKHEQSVIRSVRVPKVIQDFLKEYFKNRDDFTANDFINLLIENSDEFIIQAGKQSAAILVEFLKELA